MKNLSFIFFILLIFGFQNQTTLNTEHYLIYSTKTGQIVSLETIVTEMKKNDVLIFGEEHNDSVSHFLEFELLQKMNQAYPQKTTLSMEMFDRDVQLVMNEYLMGAIREKNFLKDARVWSNYKDYKPMIEYAKLNKINVICANAPSRYTNLVGRKGKNALNDLPKSSKQFFAPLPYDTAQGKYYDKLMALSGHNPNDTSKKKMPSLMGTFNLIHAQSLWDATMAFSISEHLTKNKNSKIFHINGKFHSDEYLAVITQLKKFNKKAKILSISTLSLEEFPKIDWKSLGDLGDFIIVTDPKVPKTY